jgi:hypothetical protein
MNIQLRTSSSINTIPIPIKYNKQAIKTLNMPFCKFCKDSGKTPREFNSHYPKDKPGKEGKVVCPTILSNECRYCRAKGHAKSHCPVLKEKNSRKRMTSVPQRFNRRGPQQTPNNLNGWAVKAMKQHRPKPNLRVQAVKYAASQNAFATLDEEGEKSKRHVALPKVVKVTAPTGSWSKKPDLSKEAIQQRLVSKRQELAVEEHLKEDEVGMTPLLSIKEACANIRQDQQILLRHGLAHVISRQEAEPEKCHEDVYDMRVDLNRRAYEAFNQEPAPSYTGSWADACCDSDSDIEEGEIKCDSFGRPETDNSAW